MTAAQALIKIGDGKDVLPFVLQTLRTSEGDLKVKACRALLELGPDARRATKDLIIALSDDQARTSASDALVKIARDELTANQKFCITADTIAKEMHKTVRNAKARLECVEILDRIGYISSHVDKGLRYVANGDPVEDNKTAATRVWKKLTGAN